MHGDFVGESINFNNKRRHDKRKSRTISQVIRRKLIFYFRSECDRV